MARGENPNSKANLKKFGTEKEPREYGKRGGQKSGQVRKERKTLREELIALLSDGDIQERLTLALVDEALKGNVRAFESIRDTIGEKPTEKVAVASIDENTINDLQKAIEKRRAK